MRDRNRAITLDCIPRVDEGLVSWHMQMNIHVIIRTVHTWPWKMQIQTRTQYKYTSKHKHKLYSSQNQIIITKMQLPVQSQVGHVRHYSKRASVRKHQESDSDSSDSDRESGKGKRATRVSWRLCFFSFVCFVMLPYFFFRLFIWLCSQIFCVLLLLFVLFLFYFAFSLFYLFISSVILLSFV